MWIAFDEMIADMINNKKLNSIGTESFIRGRKINISLVFITQPYFNPTRPGRFWPFVARGEGGGGLVGPPPIKSKLQMIDQWNLVHI